MFWDLNDIGRIRKRLGMTQKEFAERCGVSQSLIAKIERGNTEPSYRNGMRIFRTILNAIESKGKKAKDIMCKNIVSISPDAYAVDAIRIMREHDFSQLPVFEDGKNVGSISEDELLSIADKDSSRIKIKDIMSDAFPSIDENIPLKAIIPLLQYRKAVLVQKRGKFIGIITKYDILDPKLFLSWL